MRAGFLSAVFSARRPAPAACPMFTLPVLVAERAPNTDVSRCGLMNHGMAPAPLTMSCLFASVTGVGDSFTWPTVVGRAALVWQYPVRNFLAFTASKYVTQS